MMFRIKPKHLEAGSVIRIIAPSAGLPTIFPHRIDAAEKALSKLGFVVQRGKTLELCTEDGAGTPRERAEEINQAFADPEVHCILAAIGGLTATQVLPYLDYELIRANPKIYCGYSDNTLIHYALYAKTGLVTFYGPCAMTQFGEFPEPQSYTVENFMRALTDTQAHGLIQASESWTDEILEWEGEDRTRARTMKTNIDGHSWLKEGHAKGLLVGGCFGSIMQLRGTPYDANYQDSILMLETPEGNDIREGYCMDKVRHELWDLRNGGVFDQIAGLIIGRNFGYSDEEQITFDRTVLSAASDFTFPILSRVNVGHADPILTIPLHTEAEICSKRESFELLESGVS